ncbi:hypothetical protein L6261_00255 [Candidatus Parcubacteria bacterium]|nr:hypothetical protein [Candidatus Parcubacteria bacterium]
MNNKIKILISVFIVFLVIITIFFLHKPKQEKVFFSNHLWSIYRNNKFGFSVAYPSDILKPSEIHHPDKKYVDKLAKEYDLINPPKESDIINFIDSENHHAIFLAIRETKASNTDEWIEITYGEDGKGYSIATATSVSGIKAVQIKTEEPGLGYESCNINFIHEGNSYSLYFDDLALSSKEINYILKSFSFKNKD